MANLDWTCVPRSYEVTKNFLQGYRTYEHPLKLQTVTVVDSKGTRPPSLGSNASSRSSSMSLLVEPLGSAMDGTDPLSQFARQEQELKDPLTQMASEYEAPLRRREKQPADDNALNWSTRRLGILNKYTTSEKLSLSTSFLCTGGAGDSGADNIKAQTVVADKVKYRLEQLDNFDDSSMRHMMDLTQQEYIQRFDELKKELIQSWNSDQRVKALKIAIQCAKMLADTSVLQFYPSQYVLITDILDTFGKLVYERLRTKAAGAVGASAATLERERESARETCQNWFFKIASIRELLPRLYVEMAIIKCYEFVTDNEYEVALLRLTKMLRGIADPLVSTYARCYLVRVGVKVTQSKEYIRESFRDFFSVYQMIFRYSARFNLHPEIITPGTYLSLFTPALDYMLQALVHKCDLYTEEIFNECKALKNNGPLLVSILNAFKSEFIAANAVDFIQLLIDSNTVGISKGQLFRALGSCVSRCAPLQAQRVDFLNTAFQVINTFTDPNEYINCIETWAPFVAENFTIHEINRFLGNISVRMSVGKAYEKHYTQLQSILDKIMQHCKHIDLLLIQDNFFPYLDLFHKESAKIDVCKNILNIYKQHSSEEYTYNAVVTNALMYLGKILNDSVNALTVDDERRQISQLINSFITKIHFGRDFEQQLSFYVEARGTFANLDAVYITLIHAVNKLAVETYQLVNGQHTRKTAAFVKACIAYCYITIPSIAAVQQQMDLYLLSGQVALLNVCLGQADDCFEAALYLVNELPATVEVEGKPKSLETYLVTYLCNMLATLVVVPDSPEQGVLYFLRLLLDVLSKYPFKANSAGPVTVYLHALDMLYVQSLEQFPYHIPNVVSNDELYGHDQKFLAEVNNLCCQVIDAILIQLKTLGAAQQMRTQATLALDLFLRIVRYADLSKEKTFQLALNLWLLAYKSESQLDPKLIPQTLKSVEEAYKLVKDNNSQRAQCIAKLLMRMRNK